MNDQKKELTNVQKIDILALAATGCKIEGMYVNLSQLTDVYHEMVKLIMEEIKYAS